MKFHLETAEIFVPDNLPVQEYGCFPNSGLLPAE